MSSELYLKRLQVWCEKNLNKEDQHIVLNFVNEIIWEVQNETEKDMLRGKTRLLGEKHMLLHHVDAALAWTRRSQQEAAREMMRHALEEYLGITLKKRTRRKLLPHV